MWLSTDTTAVLDNALITMDHLYKTGSVCFFQNRILNKPSYYEVHYSIDRIPNSSENSRSSARPDAYQKEDKLMFRLGIADVDDHKRQLTFCNVGVEEDKKRKVLVDGQLEVLNVVGEIFSVFNELEAVGHPHHQLKDRTLDIDLKIGLDSCLFASSLTEHRFDCSRFDGSNINDVKRSTYISVEMGNQGTCRRFENDPEEAERRL